MNSKKFIPILPVVLSAILFLPGCGNKTFDNGPQIQEDRSIESETQNNNDSQQDNLLKSESENTDDLKNYTSILDDYRNFANDYNSERIDNEEYMNEPWSNMRTISVKNDDWGYTFKDLNGNGKNELLLLAKHYDGEDDIFVGAIYSLVDGKPKLLDSFRDRYRCYIGKDNYIYTFGSNSAVSQEYQRCTITSDGASIKVLEQIESVENDEDVIKYYHSKEDGQKAQITKLEFAELAEQMHKDKQQHLEFTALV